jgi:hypothetical protein
MTSVVKARNTSQLGHRTGICRGAIGMTPMLFSTEIDMGLTWWAIPGSN